VSKKDLLERVRRVSTNGRGMNTFARSEGEVPAGKREGTGKRERLWRRKGCGGQEGFGLGKRELLLSS